MGRSVRGQVRRRSSAAATQPEGQIKTRSSVTSGPPQRRMGGRIKPHSSAAWVSLLRRERGSGAWAGQVAQIILYERLALKQATLCGPFLVVARAGATERRGAAATGAALQLSCCPVARARRCCAAF